MFEETNQTLEQEMPEDIFGEEVSEPEEKPTEENGTEPGSGEGETKPEAESEGSKTTSEGVQKLTIKYNGKEQEITLEEAQALAQKGMNYDHVVAERDSRYKRELDVLDKYASMSGMTREQYVRFLEENQGKSEMQGVLKELEEEFPDAPEELLEELAKARMQGKANEREKERRAESEKQDAQARAAWGRLFAENPGLSPDKIPEAVYSQVKEGKDPNEAYLKYRLSELERLGKIEEKNKETKEKATGSLAGDGRGADKDDFLSGFDSD